MSLGKSSLPMSEMPQTLSIDGIEFRFALGETGDNVELVGQTIEFPPVRAARMHVLGVSSNADLYDYIHLLCQGEEVAAGKLCLSDFLSQEPLFGETRALAFTHLMTRAGRRDNYKPSMWYTTVEWSGPVLVDAIRFEDNPSMHVFAITFETPVGA